MTVSNDTKVISFIANFSFFVEIYIREKICCKIICLYCKQNIYNTY